MVINKTYNIEQLAETLQQEIELSKEYDKYDGIVKLDILTAYDILEVLKEIHKREQKHQTIESALIFDEKEDETQKLVRTKGDSAEYKKELKESKIPSCFGNYGTEDKEDCTCVFCEYELNCRRETEQKQKKRRPDCFGNYEEEDDWEDSCDECMYAKECKKKLY